jgi:hypothetical protein
MAEYFVGCDLGQTQDFTAIAVVGLDEAYLKAMNTRGAAYDRLERARKNPYLDEVDLRVIEHEIKAVAPFSQESGSLPEPIYEVRHLERLPLRTPYTEVARRIKALINTPPLQGNAELAVDATGVGAAVVDQLKAEGLWFEAVVITGGEKETQDDDTHRVPKRDLIARPQVLLQEGNRRLKIALALPEAKTLVDELLNYRYKITDAGNDTYGAWREGQHDDLVLALALAVWAAERFGGAPVGETLVANIGPYSISEKDLWRIDDPYYRGKYGR